MLNSSFNEEQIIKVLKAARHRALGWGALAGTTMDMVACGTSLHLRRHYFGRERCTADISHLLLNDRISECYGDKLASPAAYHFKRKSGQVRRCFWRDIRKVDPAGPSRILAPWAVPAHSF